MSAIGKLRGSIIVVVFAVGIFAWTATAKARTCSHNNDHQCWAPLSGPNYSQVAVGRTSGGAGIACAVQSSQFDDWGGRLHCFVPIGSSGATPQGFGGQEAQFNGWFHGPDPSRRIVSLAIGHVLFQSNKVDIWALRSDGNIFMARTRWPINPGEDPRIFFNPANLPPINARSIAVVGFLLYAVTTTNQLFYTDFTQWHQHPIGNVVLATGGSLSADMLVTGTSGASTQLGSITSSDPIPPLPGPLNPGVSDPNAQFVGPFGHTTPLAVGRSGLVFAVHPGSCPAGSTTPCISWGIRIPPWVVWLPFQSGDLRDAQNGEPYAMPRTIQDGYDMRSSPGEIWVIQGPQRLSFWAP